MGVEFAGEAQKPASRPLNSFDYDLVAVPGEGVLSSYHLLCQHQQLVVPGQSP